MSTQTLTLHLPDGLFTRLQQRAQESRRSIEAELLDVLSNAVGADENLPSSLAADLANLDRMNDAELMRAAGTRLSGQDAARLEALHLKRQKERLTEPEDRVLGSLVEQYER